VKMDKEKEKKYKMKKQIKNNKGGFS